MAEGGNRYVLRTFTAWDYPVYSSWWDDPPPVTSLPSIGFVSGEMKAVGFLANTDTDFAILTWWHANPKNTPRETKESLQMIIKGVLDAAKIINKNYVFCYTKNRGMIRLLERFGFINHDGHLIAGSF